MTNHQSSPAAAGTGFLSAIRRFIELRFGLGFLATITLWAALTRFAPAALIANAMRLETFLQFTVVATVNLLAATFAVSLLRVLFKRYPKEHEWSAWIRSTIGNGDEPWKSKQAATVLLASMPTPVVLLWQYGSEFSGIILPNDESCSVLIRIALGAISLLLSGAVAYVFLLGLGRLKTWLFGSEKDTRNFLPFEAVDRDGVILSRRPRVLTEWLPFEAIDYQLGAYSVLLAATHFGATRVFASHLPLVATAPLVIILIAWIAGLLLTGLAYWLDKIRFPVFVALLVSMLSFNIFMDRSYSLKPISIAPATKFTSQVHAIVNSESNALLINQDRATAFKEAAAPLEDAAWNAVGSRMKRASADKPQAKRVAVIVTCPGGGIHAAAWSSHVLESLSNKYPRFRDSICVVSGVSGVVSVRCFLYRRIMLLRSLKILVSNFLNPASSLQRNPRLNRSRWV